MGSGRELFATLEEEVSQTCDEVGEGQGEEHRREILSRDGCIEEHQPTAEHSGEGDDKKIEHLLTFLSFVDVANPLEKGKLLSRGREPTMDVEVREDVPLCLT